jgi:hypothetical protein
LDDSRHGKPMGGEGTVAWTFRLTGRGFVVVLEEVFTGIVRVGQVLESPAGRTLINAVEQGHGREAEEVKAFVGLVVEDAAAPLFAKGQRVKFYEPG